MPVFKAGKHRINWGEKTLVIGILNITPDSFSDGGDYFDFSSAAAQADALIAEGVDIIDIGGESARPGSRLISIEEELKRVLPLVKYISGKYSEIPISVDTWKHEVAEAVLENGAAIINDIYGLWADDKLADVVSKYKAGLILMHNAVIYRHNHPAAKMFDSAWRMNPVEAIFYEKMSLGDSVEAVFQASIEKAVKSGIDLEQIMLDPGIGFGISGEESLALVRNLSKLQKFNLPLLIAPSRKRFIGDILNLPVQERDIGTAAVVSVSIAEGAAAVRVHNASVAMQTVKICDAIFASVSDKSSHIHDGKPDIVRLKGLQFYGYTGVMEEEKKIGQRFVVDVTMELQNNKASKTDELSETVNYAEVYELIKAIVSCKSFDLIERLAGYIADQIINQFKIICSVEVTVGKPQAPVSGIFNVFEASVKRYALKQ